jgi:hypothetical protein
LPPGTEVSLGPWRGSMGRPSGVGSVPLEGAARNSSGLSAKGHDQCPAARDSTRRTVEVSASPTRPRFSVMRRLLPPIAEALHRLRAAERAAAAAKRDSVAGDEAADVAAATADATRATAEAARGALEATVVANASANQTAAAASLAARSATYDAAAALSKAASAEAAETAAQAIYAAATTEPTAPERNETRPAPTKGHVARNRTPESRPARHLSAN